jgi:hypothetical protein
LAHELGCLEQPEILLGQCEAEGTLGYARLGARCAR